MRSAPTAGFVLRPIVEENSGVWSEDKPVVIDENLVSSRRPSDMRRFTGTINDWLRRNVKAPIFLRASACPRPRAKPRQLSPRGALLVQGRFRQYFRRLAPSIENRAILRAVTCVSATCRSRHGRRQSSTSRRDSRSRLRRNDEAVTTLPVLRPRPQSPSRASDKPRRAGGSDYLRT